MRRSLKIVALAIGLTAFTLLAILGFAIWVFIPLLPAGVIFVLAVAGARSRRKKSEAVEEVHEGETDTRKAA